MLKLIFNQPTNNFLFLLQVVLSRADAEALDIQLYPIERPSSSMQVTDQATQEDEVAAAVAAATEKEMSQVLTSHNQMEEEGEQQQLEMPNGGNQEEEMSPIVPTMDEVDEESLTRQMDQDEPSQEHTSPSIEHISLTSAVAETPTAALVATPVMSTVSLDAASLTRLAGNLSNSPTGKTTTATIIRAASGAPSSLGSPQATSSSANDVLSNIIQSLFTANANEAAGGSNSHSSNNSNVTIVPRMVGGKRKLCLRLPASTASALLAQTGGSSTLTAQGIAAGLASVASGGKTGSGGMPKRIKIVIPPGSSISGVQQQLQDQILAQQQQQQHQKVIKVSMHSNSTVAMTSRGATNNVKTSATAVTKTISGPARFVESEMTSIPTRSSMTLTAFNSRTAKSTSSASKSFLASHFILTAPISP